MELGFKRYVGVGSNDENIHRFGELLHQREQKRLLRKKRSCYQECSFDRLAA